MNPKQNKAQQLKTQVIELGRASELTLGWGGVWSECTRNRQQFRTVKTVQVTELGKATELTLGQAGRNFEGSLFRPVRW